MLQGVEPLHEELEALQISYLQSVELATKLLPTSSNESPSLIAERLFDLAQAIRREDMKRRPYVYTGESEF